MKTKLLAVIGLCAAVAAGPLWADTAKSGAHKTSSSATSTQKAGTASNNRTDGAAQGGTLLVLMPVLQVNDQMGNGCWVRFYDGRNYRGNSLTLVGPVDMPRMDVPGAAWHDFDSAIVGPKAKVTVYDEENFHDKDATLTPGQHAADLEARELGWFEEVKSARVSCSS